MFDDDYSEADYEENYGLQDDEKEEDFVDEPDRVIEALEDEADIIEGEMRDEYIEEYER